MAIVTLVCRDTPGLKLGPGLPGSKNVIEFEPVYAGPGKLPEYGVARLDTDDPSYEMKMTWTHSFGCPPIEVVDPDEEQAIDASTPGACLCPCGMPWVDAGARDRHQAATHCTPPKIEPEGAM